MTLSDAAERPGAGSGDDLGQLYARLGRQVERMVRAGVRAPDPVIEDACQFAWTHLIPRRQRVRPEKMLGWLTTTATHEALDLLRRDHRELSWEEEADTVRLTVPGPEEVLMQRERLAAADFPPRQRRLLWLHAFGFSYTEMAHLEDCTRRTVERQLLRARRAVRTPPPLPTAPARASGACAQLD